jgi:hypothetical protein
MRRGILYAQMVESLRAVGGKPVKMDRFRLRKTPSSLNMVRLVS